MINRICKNISNLIYLVGDKSKCKLDTEYIDSFIIALIPTKDNKECLSDRQIRKFIKGEVKDLELMTLFSIAYSVDISMEKFMLDETEFKDIYISTMVLPKKVFNLNDMKLKKIFIKKFQVELNQTLKLKLKTKEKSKKYFLYKQSKKQYIFEIMSNKNTKLPRVNTLLKLLESIGCEEIDIFIESLYDSWSKEIEIYYRTLEKR
ncbi:MAG: hypothetical protein RR942_17770 [Romboutsia sp.]